jgi:hypothetical protein
MDKAGENAFHNQAHIALRHRKIVVLSQQDAALGHHFGPGHGN